VIPRDFGSNRTGTPPAIFAGIRFSYADRSRPVKTVSGVIKEPQLANTGISSAGSFL
jgi:hypothetical protein